MEVMLRSHFEKYDIYDRKLIVENEIVPLYDAKFNYAFPSLFITISAMVMYVD